MLALQRRNTGIILQDSYIFNLVPFPKLWLHLWSTQWQPRELLDYCLSFSLGSGCCKPIGFIFHCLGWALSFFQGSAVIPNLSDKPDKWVLVSCIAASSPFSPCGIWLSSHLVSNDVVFSSYPVFGSVYTRLEVRPFNHHLLLWMALFNMELILCVCDVLGILLVISYNKVKIRGSL